MEEPGHSQPVSSPSSVNVSSSISQAPEEENDQNPYESNSSNQQQHDQQEIRRFPSVFYRYRINISSSLIQDDVWFCLTVLVTFWFFASMTMILGFYGSVSLQLGLNCSRLVKVNSLFVQSIKVERTDETKPGPVIYGFDKSPPLDVETTWSETHDPFIPVNFHKEWVYFLNKGSKLDISYEVKSPSVLPLSLVIAQGSESLMDWIQDPSYPNTTLSWNIIYGSGKIQQEIPESSTYYIAVGNLNSEEVEVQLKFNLKAFLYNTTQANFNCSLNNHVCSLKLLLLKESVAVLTSPGPEEVTSSDPWYVKVSYGPRWIIYIVGSGMMTVLVVLLFRLCNILQASDEEGTNSQGGDMAAERAPLLAQKDEDLSSWGSSYDSNSHDEEDLEELVAANSIEGGVNSNNPPRLCVICFDSPRDCFFLPCGHCAACFTCGTRIAEEAGTCPICRRKMKKVRKIFTV